MEKISQTNLPIDPDENSPIAAVVFVETPEGTPLVRDSKKPVPVFWKIPGGRGKPNETPEKVAVRELEEETGVIVKESELKLIYQENRGNHDFFLFTTKLPFLPKLRDEGDEGEEIRVFTKKEMGDMDNFFNPHKTFLKDKGII